MQLVQYPVAKPEEAVAIDELLLKKAEAGEIGETLRFWGTDTYFIVVGRAGKVSEECFLRKCRRDKIRIIRRISGGGTVLQGPGCFNWSAVISYKRDEKYRDIRYSYRSILNNIADIFKTNGCNVEFFPLSDLALNDRKISGNAQARKRKYFLHHGTFLFDFDLKRMSRYLKYPPLEPEYRRKRKHEDFLTNIFVPAEELERIIKNIFSVSRNVLKLRKNDMDDLRELVRLKYTKDAWNYVF